MKINGLFYLLIVLSVYSCKPKNYESPVNPTASASARELLSFIYSMSGEYTLSGQHNYSHELTRSTDSIYALTQKYPAIWGSDFIGEQHRDEMIEEAIRQHEKGSIITLMYHQGRPYADSLGHFRDSIDSDDWQKLVTPGTDIHQTWQDDIDKVAEHLKVLQDNDVPVLWRPYHEMNGIWFWWCNKRGDDGIKKLWKMMYSRFTEHHQLNNLIWVWNPNAPRDWPNDEAYAYDLFYPGHDYVDILAADIYKGDYKKSHHDQLDSLADGRPIAIGECGVLPQPEIFAEQPQWTWFMVWARFNWRNNTPGQVTAMYYLPRVINLSEIDSIAFAE